MTKEKEDYENLSDSRFEELTNFKTSENKKIQIHTHVHMSKYHIKPRDRIEADSLQMMRYWYKIALNITRNNSETKLRENREKVRDMEDVCLVRKWKMTRDCCFQPKQDA